jgi:hypothetical protein
MTSSKKIPYIKKIEANVCPQETIDIINRNLSSIVNAFKAEASPVYTLGDIKASLSKTDENGWFVCDGRLFDLELFPQLRTLVTQGVLTQVGPSTVLLPDLRGRFLRGYDSSNERDPDFATRYNILGNTSGNSFPGTYQDHAQEIEKEAYDYYYSYSDTIKYREYTFNKVVRDASKLSGSEFVDYNEVKKAYLDDDTNLQSRLITEKKDYKQKVEAVKLPSLNQVINRDNHELKVPIANNEQGVVRGIASQNSGINSGVESRPKNMTVVYKLYIGEPNCCSPEELPEWNVEDANVWFPANFSEPLDCSSLSALSAIYTDLACDPFDLDNNLDTGNLQQI